MEKGTPYEGRFARTRFTLPQLSSFARLCPALFFCTGLAIVPVPAAAQMIGFGGFGIGGGLGLPGLMHHGFGGGYGTGRGSGPPGFMSHGGPGFAGRGFRGGPPWGQHSGQSQLRQQSPLGADGGGRRNYGHWPSHGQPSQVGTREFPARRNCGGGPCRPTDSPWRGQGHPSKVGTTEVPPGRRAVSWDEDRPSSATGRSRRDEDRPSSIAEPRLRRRWRDDDQPRSVRSRRGRRRRDEDRPRRDDEHSCRDAAQAATASDAEAAHEPDAARRHYRASGPRTTALRWRRRWISLGAASNY